MGMAIHAALAGAEGHAELARRLGAELGIPAASHVEAFRGYRLSGRGYTDCLIRIKGKGEAYALGVSVQIFASEWDIDPLAQFLLTEIYKKENIENEVVLESPFQARTVLYTPRIRTEMLLKVSRRRSFTQIDIREVDLNTGTLLGESTCTSAEIPASNW